MRVLFLAWLLVSGCGATGPLSGDAGTALDGGLPFARDGGASPARDGGTPGADGGAPALDGGTAATLRIVTPAQGAVVSGILTVAVEASSEIARVELYVDGRLTAESTTPPHQFSWDSSAHENPLPAADHEMDFGYYFVDGRYGDFRAEVNPYTNLYYAWVWRNYPTDQPWEPPFRVSLQNAHREGRRIHLNLQDEAYWDAALDIAAPYFV